MTVAFHMWILAFNYILELEPCNVNFCCVRRLIEVKMCAKYLRKQADVIGAFNTTSRYLDDILNINNVYFDNMVSQIHPSELQLKKSQYI